MTVEFCTLFDAAYLPRALVLYRSLTEVCPSFLLRAVCMDDESKVILDRLALPHLQVLSLAELEAHDPALAAVKADRQPVEYYWTATPALVLFCLDREPDLDSITYVDADLVFFADPGSILDTVRDASIVLTPHQYSREYEYLEEESGTYNVQFLTFRRDEQGLEALRWWRERCLEWCYARVEDGKMGDQKYLDDWPERFGGVRVLKGVEAGLAPWNAERFQIEERDGTLFADRVPAIFYHFHSLRLYRGITLLRRVGLFHGYQLLRASIPLVWTSYPLSPEQRELIWEPYLRRLATEVVTIRGVRTGFEAGFLRVRPVRALLLAARFRAAAASGRVRRAGRLSQSWKSADVAAQMSSLAEANLREPERVAPFRAFVAVMTMLVERHPLPERPRILDFGCGVGHYADLLDRAFPRFEYVGCDYSEAMIAEARSRRPDHTYLVNDLFDNRLELETFDVILAGALVDVIDRFQEALQLLLGSGAQYLVLHRQRMTHGASRVDIVGGYKGQRTYASHLGFDELEVLAEKHGRRVAETVRVDEGIWSFLLPLVDA